LERVADRPMQFSSGGRPLVGMLHLPAGQAREPGFVFCNAFGDERKSSCLAMTRLARALAGVGHPALRFDYWGCGDSPGEFVDATLSTRLGDVCSAAQVLRERAGVGSVCLLGLRLGAAIAARASGAAGCCGLALIAPVADGAEFFRTQLRRRLVRRMLTAGSAARAGERAAGEQVVDLDGYALRRGVLEELRGLRIEPGAVALDGPALVLQVSFSERLTPQTLRVRDALEAAGARVEVGAVVLPPFWSRIEITDTAPVEAAVLEWVSRRWGE